MTVTALMGHSLVIALVGFGFGCAIVGFFLGHTVKAERVWQDWVDSRSTPTTHQYVPPAPSALPTPSALPRGTTTARHRRVNTRTRPRRRIRYDAPAPVT